MYLGKEGRKEGRKEENNPWRLLITHTGFYVYVSSDLLSHFQGLRILFYFSFLGTLCSCLKSQSLFGLVNLVLCMSIDILPRRYITHYCLPMPD